MTIISKISVFYPLKIKSPLLLLLSLCPNPLKYLLLFHCPNENRSMSIFRKLGTPLGIASHLFNHMHSYVIRSWEVDWASKQLSTFYFSQPFSFSSLNSLSNVKWRNTLNIRYSVTLFACALYYLIYNRGILISVLPTFGFESYDSSRDKVLLSLIVKDFGRFWFLRPCCLKFEMIGIYWNPVFSLCMTDFSYCWSKFFWN